MLQIKVIETTMTGLCRAGKSLNKSDIRSPKHVIKIMLCWKSFTVSLISYHLLITILKLGLWGSNLHLKLYWNGKIAKKQPGFITKIFSILKNVCMQHCSFFKLWFLFNILENNCLAFFLWRNDYYLYHKRVSDQIVFLWK